MKTIRQFVSDNSPISVIILVVFGLLVGTSMYSLGPIFSGYARIVW